MAGAKLLLGVMMVVLLFNLLFYLAGWMPSLVSAEAIIGYLVSIGIIGILVSLIPTTSASGAVTYLLSAVIMLLMLYDFNFEVGGYPVQVGIGLVSNLAGLFDSSSTGLSFIPWLFFQIMGLIGVLGGIVIIGGGQD